MSLDPDLAGVIRTYAALKTRDNPTAGVGDCAHCDPIVEFRDSKVRKRFCRTVIGALLRDHPTAFEARSRSPPLVDDPLPFLTPDN